MNIRFYNARILTETMDITEGELWVRGNTICYIEMGRMFPRSVKNREM